MVKEVITKCDVCGREGAKRHSFVYDRRMDAAGSMENIYHDVDLCVIHFDELVLKFGHPREHRSRYQDRAAARAYGRRVKQWAEVKAVWKRMTPEERQLAISIEEARG